MRKCKFTAFTHAAANSKSEVMPFDGMFHSWTRDVDVHGKVVPRAIVESDAGDVYLVPPHVVKFEVIDLTQMKPGQIEVVVSPEQEIVAIMKRIEGRINASTIGFDGFLHTLISEVQHAASLIIENTRR